MGVGRVGSKEARQRTERTQNAIRTVLEEAAEPLTAAEILDRIQHPVGNGMNRVTVGHHCGRMKCVGRVSAKGKGTNKWEYQDPGDRGQDPLVGIHGNVRKSTKKQMRKIKVLYDVPMYDQVRQALEAYVDNHPHGDKEA